jgi:glycosyltransferase involved in cell wall biosynthesis
MSRFNVGGTSQWLYQLSRGLDERKIENLLIIGDCPKGEREDLRLRELNSMRISGLGPKTHPLHTLRAFLALRKEIKLYNPDIVNTHTSKAGFLGRIATKSLKSKAKVVHTYHGHVLHGYFNPFFETIIRFTEILLSRFTDLFLVSGEQVLRDLQEAKIIKNKPAMTIWPAVPEIKVGNRIELRKSWGIPQEALVFGWLGRKVPIKRIDRILELARERPNYIFILAGDGAAAKETFPEYFLNGELANVMEREFTSPSDLWAVADVCLLTSDNEAMPISPIEAALCGRSVIAIDAGSTREVVLDGETGFVSPKSQASLLSLVDQLASSKALREKMGGVGHDFASSRFSPESSIERQIVGYAKALSC